MAIAERQLRERQEQELAGLDALETVTERPPSFPSRVWASLWPKLLAIGIVVGGWQLLVMSGWKSQYILPSPFTVFDRLWTDMHTAEFWNAINVTMQRAVKGYALALIIGVTIGLAVSRSRVLRAGVGSLITGLQTMPSVAWFPLAILLFKLTDAAIMFVIVLGAAPSIANGLIHGVDHVPPIMLRAGRVLGAKGFSSYRYVILPAALPSFTAGLKQGWAFSWRSLHGRRAARRHRQEQVARLPAGLEPGPARRPRPDGHDDRHPRHRHPRRRPLLLADREAAAPALGPRPGLTPSPAALGPEVERRREPGTSTGRHSLRRPIEVPTASGPAPPPPR